MLGATPTNPNCHGKNREECSRSRIYEGRGQSGCTIGAYFTSWDAFTPYAEVMKKVSEVSLLVL